MSISSILSSPLKNKRFRAVMSDGSHVDFGLKGGSTYIDHFDVKKRSAYRKRHLGNPIERHLIENNIVSPALLSYAILWGDSMHIDVNAEELNKKLKKIALK